MKTPYSNEKVEKHSSVVFIGVITGKLYLRCGRRRSLPGKRLPGRLKRLFRRHFDNDDRLRRKASAIVSRRARIEPWCWMDHRPGEIPRRGVNHRARLKSSGGDAAFAVGRAMIGGVGREGTALGIGGVDGLDERLDFAQLKRRDNYIHARGHERRICKDWAGNRGSRAAVATYTAIPAEDFLSGAKISRGASSVYSG